MTTLRIFLQVIAADLKSLWADRVGRPLALLFAVAIVVLFLMAVFGGTD